MIINYEEMSDCKILMLMFIVLYKTQNLKNLKLKKNPGRTSSLSEYIIFCNLQIKEDKILFIY